MLNLLAPCAQAMQVARNVTTNELANWPRYAYLRGPDGTFHNPFDLGCVANCNDAFRPASAPLPTLGPNAPPETMSLLKMEQGQSASEQRAL